MLELTRDEYEDHRRMLDELRRIRDRDLPQLLRDARAFVAADATEEIAQIEADRRAADRRIAQLEGLLSEARVIDDQRWRAGSVAPGRLVRVRYHGSGRETAFVVSSRPSGAARAVSAGSPVGRALLGRAAGDTVTVELPSGRVERLEVLAVEDAGDREAA